MITATIEWLRAWALWGLPACGLVAWYLSRRAPRAAPVAVLTLPPRLWRLLRGLSSPAGAGRRRGLRLLLATLGWLALVLALATPLTRGQPLPTASGRDLLLAVDLSASMRARDVRLDGREVDRFSAVKSLAGEFIRGREGDRLGLIVFADRSYLLAPLTYDVDAAAGFLEEAVVGLPGQKTAIGDAIGLAVKTLRRQPPSSRVLILLSDGDSNAGDIGLQRAVALAASHQVRIHTIGFGRAERGQAGGGMVLIAAATDGRHFDAPTTTALRSVYAELDLIEPTVSDSEPLLARRGWQRELLWLAWLALLGLTVLDRSGGRL